MIYGNEGRDILKGKAGNDLVQGAEGNDKIFGDRGNDILVGAQGNDILTGGYETDIFICGTASDTITDFNLTQKDSTPYNDCENIKKIDGADSESLLLHQQQDQDIENINNNKEMIDNTKKINDRQKQDNGFFFGLFK